MNIVCISDLHGNLPDIPPCDLLLVAGDITPVYDHKIAFQAKWLNTDFKAWIESTPAKHRVVIAGNHDYVFEESPELLNKTDAYHYLQDSSVTIEGFKVWGTPWQPWFYDWAFNLYEPDLLKKWALIPEDTDIIVVHGPPHLCGDKAPRREPPGYEHVGSPGLAERIKQVQPGLVVTGHIHEGRGVYSIGKTIVANASILDGQYVWRHEPMVFELNKKL